MKKRKAVISRRARAKQSSDFDGWLPYMPEKVRQAAKGLINSPVKEFLTNADFHEAVQLYDRASQDDSWDLVPRRERNAWLKKFNKTTRELLSLIEAGPIPATKWGFPVKGAALMGLLRTAGLEVPPEEDEYEYIRKMFAVERKLEQTNTFTLADAIDLYSLKARNDAMARQYLKKPRDQKATRALFIVLMKEYTKLPVSVIAKTAAVMFEDSSIDEKLVRRLKSSK